MYCSKYFQKSNNGDKFCSQCGKKYNNQDEIYTFDQVIEKAIKLGYIFKDDVDAHRRTDFLPRQS